MGKFSVQLEDAEVAKTLDDLDAIGNRFAGTPGELRCRDYVVERFRQIGLAAVRFESFPYLAYEPGSASCRVIGPLKRNLPCHALQYSAVAKVDGEGIFVDGASPADLERLDRLGVDLAGKIVIAQTTFPFVVGPELEKYGIAGLIHIGETPAGTIGHFTATLYPPPLEAPWEGRPLSFPGVTIDAADARELISTMTAGRSVRIAIEHDANYVEKESWNVIGEIPGSGTEQVVLGAHYDSQMEGPCVFDNGAGLASLIESARALRGRTPRRTIQVISFGAEEIGAWGATSHVDRHAEEMERTVAMVNLDGTASAYPSRRELWVHPALGELAVETAKDVGWEPDTVLDTGSYPAFADHAAFLDAGVPACLAWRPEHPYYHSVRDVRELVDASVLVETATVSTAIAKRLAEQPELRLG